MRAVLSAFIVLLLTGCALKPGQETPISSNPVSVASSATITGKIKGGQQPVSNAIVQVWQVGTTGYGMGAARLGSSAVSGSDGSFTLTGKYSCSAAAAGNNTLVYVTADGGNPGLPDPATNNSAISMLVGLGTCGSLSASTFISINEVTTVASVYALAQFIGPGENIGSYGSSSQGLANAFATISNLVDTTAGVVRSVTPQGNGIVPQAELNTLGNIISPCVNSASPASPTCAGLFKAVTPGNGTAPTTVLAAALQIALNPGYNVSGVLGQSNASAPFQPSISAANDWTVALAFASGGGVPAGVAVDATGDLWVANYSTGGSASSVSLLSPTGVPASNSPFSNANVNGASALAIDTKNNVWVANHDNNTAVELNATAAGAVQVEAGPFAGLNAPASVAIDRTNDIWFVNQGNNSLTELLAANPAGTPNAFTTLGLNVPSSIAFDGANNAWIANNGGGSVTKFAPGLTPVTATSYTGGGLTSPAGVAIDGSSNVWVTDPNLGEVARLNSTGTPVTTASGYTGGGLTGAQADAIDGNGSVWVADAKGNALSALSSSGSALSPSTGYQGGSLSSPVSLAIDSSGNIWIANGAPLTRGGQVATLTEFVGLAAPVITPLAQQVSLTQIAQRPGTPQPLAVAGGPYSGTTGAAVSFSGASSTAPAGQSLTYSWSFGDGTSGTGATPAHVYAVGGSYTASLVVTATDGASAMATATVAVGQPAPVIAGFAPASGPVGTVVAVSGTNLAAPAGSATQVLLAQQGGSSILAPVSAITSTSLSFVIPAGAATGPFSVSSAGQSATSSTALTVTTSSTYTLAVTPGTGTLLQGQSTSLAVTISSSNNFAGVASLSVSGVPSGVSASFQPASLAVGQTALLTLTAPSGQAVGTANLTLTAAATIDGLPFSQTAGAQLNIKPTTTTFLGRTVVDDAAQEPIAGVTVSFTGKDMNGNTTGCSGSTVTDGGGNFVLSNLPAACTGPQLISYNGMTATAPAGQYAGVNLSYTLVSGQVVASPVLVHLPRIDNAETVMVAQNASTDQIFYFHTIPGVKVTVYAGTTLSLDDGSQPNPFPLVAISIPLDRLPEKMATTGMLMPFIVAFQPANAVASQPVAVNFPNSLGIAPNSSVMFVTLDPTHGYMVPYGTGTVSNDGTEFIADPDPNHPGHAYGLVHFDWHGPATAPPNTVNPGPKGSPQEGDPVDLASGLLNFTHTDIEIGGHRGGLRIDRVYRSVSTSSGPFGLGGSHNYAYQLNTFPLLQDQGYVGLVMPDGNQYNMQQTPNGTYINSVIPELRGAVISGSTAAGAFTLTWVDGTVYNFTIFSALGQRAAFLTSITDLNGNKTTMNVNSANPYQLLSVTDPVGRSLTFTYDSSNRITQILDPLGRKLQYAYNSSGGLTQFTDAKNGVTKYTYDSSNNLATMTDPRGVKTLQNTYNDSFDGRISQQIQADGGVFKFAYTLQNPTQAASPVLQTVVTNPAGAQTTYRFDMQGFLQSVTDASGQTRTLTHDPTHNNLVSDYVGGGSCSVCGNSKNGDIHLTFDAVGNVLTEKDSLGNQTSFAYDTRFNKLNSVTNALGNPLSMTFDAQGNLLTVTDADGHTKQNAYDQFGEMVQTTDATGAKTTFGYDSYGDVVSITNPLGNTTYYTFDGASRLIQKQDALGRKTVAALDTLDRITTITDPLGNKSQLTYDAIGGLLKFIDPKGNASTFVYDSDERLLSVSGPNGTTESYAYDQNSNRTKYTDRRGLVANYSYDVMNRLAQAAYSDATVQYTYDPAGRLLGIQDSTDGSFSFKYDARGRLTQQSEPTGVVEYTRDALGRIGAEQVVGQNAIHYTYDAAGNLTGIATNGASVTYQYDTRNEVSKLTRSNGVTSTMTYDAAQELLSLTHANGAATLDQQQYAYDPAGRRSNVKNGLFAPLTTQSAVASVDANNALLTFNQSSFTNDADGNRLTDRANGTGNTYTWDGRNRLATITKADGTVLTMHYDSVRGLLGVTSSAGGTSSESFVEDSRGNIVELLPATGSPLTVLSGNSENQYVATVDASGNAVFGLMDAIGSTLATVGVNGAEANDVSYEPYGMLNAQLSVAYPFGFAGTLNVAGSIYYDHARYYDGTTDRFLSQDPAGIAGGANLFAYAGGDPINNVDPSGKTTATVSINLSFSLGFLTVQAQVGFAVDDSGDVGFFYAGGGGATAPSGIQAQAGVGFSLSNAQTINDLAGPFTNASAGLGDGVDVQVDGYTGSSDHGQVTGYGGSVGVGFGASASVTETTTVVVPLFGPNSGGH